MEENIRQNEEIATNASNPSLLSWELFWRYVFSQASLLFFFAAIVCFFAYNWADMSVFTKFSLIAGLMILTALLPLAGGLEGFSGSAGLLFCGLLAGPLLAVYGQYYQTGANAWELFRTWAIFLLPLAVIGRRTGLWFTLWVVASLAFFLFLEQKNTLHSHGYDAWISLPFVLSQIAFLIFWEVAAALRPSEKLAFLASRWLPRLVAGLILFYLTMIMGDLILFGPRMEEVSFSPFFSHRSLVYFLFLCACAAYYTKKVHDLPIIAMGLASLVTTGLMALIRYHEGGWMEGSFFLLLAAYLFLASVIGVKILLFCHKLGEKTGKEEKLPEEIHPAPENTNPAASSPLTLLNLQNLFLALGGTPVSALSEKPGGRPEETSHWVIPFLMGLGAWVTALFLLAGLAILLESFMEENAMIVLFLVIMGIGAVFSRGRGVFARQTGLCLGLAGTMGASIFILIVYGSFFKNYEQVPTILLFIFGIVLIPNRIYRLIGSATVISCFFIQVLTMMTFTNYKFLFFPVREIVATEGGLLWFLLVFLFGAFAVGLVHFWFKPMETKKRGFLQNPLLSGAFFSLIILALFLYFNASTLRMFGYMRNFAFSAMGLGAGMGLFWFSFCISRELRLKTPVMPALMGISILLAAAGFRIYWIPTGFLLLCLARHAASLPFMGLGVSFLSLMTVLEYYNQTTSLLHKSCSLAVLGFFFAVLALGLHRILKSVFREENKKFPEQSEDTAGHGFLPDKLGRGVVLLCLCAFLLLFAGSVREKEALLVSGERLVLSIRPLDPRSLMQGDYMILDLEVEGQIDDALDGQDRAAPVQLQGVAVVKPDEQGVARFLRLDDGSPLGENEIRLVYRRKSRGIQVSSGSFFFQEGHGNDYNAARFAVLRVDEDGDALITDLLDGEQKVIVGGK